MVLLQGLDQKDLYHFKKDNHRIRWSLRAQQEHQLRALRPDDMPAVPPGHDRDRGEAWQRSESGWTEKVSDAGGGQGPRVAVAPPSWTGEPVRQQRGEEVRP